MFKAWFESKTVWLNILTALAGIIQLVIEFLNGVDFSVNAIFLLLVGVVNIIIRIFFTKTEIERG